MQAGINQTGHFVKKDIIERAYSQLREFLCPRVFPVLPDAKSKTRQEEEDRRKKYFGYFVHCKESSSHASFLVLYVQRGIAERNTEL